MTHRRRAMDRADAAWVLLAALLTVVGQLEAWTALDATRTQVVAAAATTLPVALAGRSPYTALVLVHGLHAGHALLTRSDEFTVAGLLAMMATLYGVGAGVPVRRAFPAWLPRCCWRTWG